MVAAVGGLVSDIHALLAGIVGPEHVLTGAAAPPDYRHDEALGVPPGEPAYVVRPGSTAEVAAVLRAAAGAGMAVTARGAGTGLSGAAVPRPGALVASFERMDQILELDAANHVAVVQPGVTLAALDEAAARHGLIYPVYPGEMSASLGGTIATNAGGMRAVKYGVTRRHVLGLEAVLASGEVLRSGGKNVKNSSGYDLTQLIIGSEGTLALVTEATVRLYPRLPAQATLLAPFGSLAEVTTAVPRIVASGAGPLILEYVDLLTMAAVTADTGLDLGIPATVRDAAQAWLVVVQEERTAGRLEEAVTELGELLSGAGALDVYVLPAADARQLIEAREQAFWAARRAGADDILDTVVPRAAMAGFLGEVAEIATRRGRLVLGCGHAGDGNVHLALFEPDPAARGELIHEILAAARTRGGAVSGEHGIGTAKAAYFLELADPAAVMLMRRIKAAFDPDGILNPGVLFGEVPDGRENHR
jgi:glycolate dehydrogenase FAD-linked subunit